MKLNKKTKKIVIVSIIVCTIAIAAGMYGVLIRQEIVGSGPYLNFKILKGNVWEDTNTMTITSTGSHSIRVEIGAISYDLFQVQLRWSNTIIQYVGVSSEVSASEASSTEYYFGNVYPYSGPAKTLFIVQFNALTTGSVKFKFNIINTYFLDSNSNEIPYSYDTSKAYIDDGFPPMISNVEINHSGEIGINQQVTVSALITDGGSGVDISNGRPILYYTMGGSTQIPITMQRINGNAGSGTYQATIPASVNPTTVTYQIEAWDNAGNSRKTTLATYAIVPEYMTVILITMIISSIVVVSLFKFNKVNKKIIFWK